ncbi:hypothetical protein [Spirosoma endophyticum]|uniref:Uncharacterized protein n=1 Tax=Spirosoma endophyticum TaxID=662367 RepID=A0A1I2H9M9_9BACT|nr:hypothetical protein [Spirosoma endophyticum]SFF25677.1 hypothetical protein SAMN05216167_1394 [Spirosoma endophyticum]
MTTEALSGEVSKVGKAGRNYVFGFGWSCRYNLEQIYGPGLKGIFEDPDQASVIANTLLAALQARAANQIPDGFSKKEMYALLDDIGEAGVAEVWNAAKQSMGFMTRSLGLSEEDVTELAAAATKHLNEPQNQPTGADLSQ